jgi:hypothetical protein
MGKFKEIFLSIAQAAGRKHFRAYFFGYLVYQILFVLDVPVQGGGLDPQDRSQGAHREILQTIPVQNVYGRPDNGRR